MRWLSIRAPPRQRVCPRAKNPMSSTFTCPKGHSSVDNDFCSECGSKIQGAAPIVPAHDSPSGGKVCPDCGAPVPPAGVNFCEICGYNFRAQTSSQFPLPRSIARLPLLRLSPQPPRGSRSSSPSMLRYELPRAPKLLTSLRSPIVSISRSISLAETVRPARSFPTSHSMWIAPSPTAMA